MSDALVRTLIEVRRHPRAIAPPSETKALSLEEAYAVQDQVREAMLAGGERLAGWKAAFTNAAMQKNYGTA